MHKAGHKSWNAEALRWHPPIDKVYKFCDAKAHSPWAVSAKALPLKPPTRFSLAWQRFPKTAASKTNGLHPELASLFIDVFCGLLSLASLHAAFEKEAGFTHISSRFSRAPSGRISGRIMKRMRRRLRPLGLLQKPERCVAPVFGQARRQCDQKSHAHWNACVPTGERVWF